MSGWLEMTLAAGVPSGNKGGASLSPEMQLELSVFTSECWQRLKSITLLVYHFSSALCC